MPLRSANSGTRYPWWLVVIGLLVLTNVIALVEVVRVRSVTVPLYEAEVHRSQTTLGGVWAMLDFENGERRQYEPIPAGRGAQIADTGRRDGPFEIWTWTYTDHVVGGAAAGEAFVESYNQKMRQLAGQSASGD
ncbi:MAG: hypothetical protein AAFY08_10645 [Planctomycetota bacterium]